MSVVERTTELKSLEAVKAMYGEKWPRFFNNFSTKFPPLHQGSLADGRGQIEADGMMNLPFSAYHKPENRKRFGQKYLAQTPREFFEMVDKVTMELGISPEEINELKKLRIEAGSDDLAKKYLEQLQELIAPVYFRLREMGYGHWELTM